MTICTERILTLAPSIYTQMDKSELWVKKDVLENLLFCFAYKEIEAQKA